MKRALLSLVGFLAILPPATGEETDAALHEKIPRGSHPTLTISPRPAPANLGPLLASARRDSPRDVDPETLYERQNSPDALHWDTFDHRSNDTSDEQKPIRGDKGEGSDESSGVPWIAILAMAVGVAILARFAARFRRSRR